MTICDLALTRSSPGGGQPVSYRVVPITSASSRAQARSEVVPQRTDDDADAQGLELLSELARVVCWELRLPETDLTWLTPLDHLIANLPDGLGYRLAPTGADGASGGRLVTTAEVGPALLEPIVGPARVGIVADSYELLQELQVPGGSVHQILVRASTIRSGGVTRIAGIITEVSTHGTASWVNTDVGERLQLLVEHNPDGIIVHRQGVILYANPAALRFAGLSRLDEAVGQPMTLFVDPGDIGPILERIDRLKEPGDSAKGHEVVLRRPDGSAFTVEIVSVRTTWGGEPAFQVILRDVSERKRAEEAARARLALERRYAAAVAALDEGVVVVNRLGSVCAANDSANRILGDRLPFLFGDAIFTGNGPALRMDGQPFAAADLPLSRWMHTRQSSTDVMIGVLDGSGSRQWLSVSTRPIGDGEDLDEGAIVCSISDVTERKRLLDRLAWEARHDPMTGLANRSGFLAVFDSALRQPMAGDTGLVLFVFGLDRFKLVNDSLGHAAGNEVLQETARRLHQCMPEALSIGRLHGDEFAALEGGIPDVDAALARAEELRTRLGQPIRLGTGRQVTVTPSIGFVHPEPGRDPADLLQDADVAVLHAKTKGRGRVVVFDASLREQLAQRVELEHDLRQAVEATHQLRLEYQPIASLATGRILGFEALARWEHPIKGLLPPDLFIGLAEESDLIVGLGSWVVGEACRQLAEWQSRYGAARDLVMSVNVSPRQLESLDLVASLRESLERNGLPPGLLLLEITESSLAADDTDIQDVLTQIQALGVRLAIDDFGTGYSSLSYLKRLPVSYIKIDRSFVDGLGGDPQDERIVSAITDLAHGLGMRVIAEGVEGRGQRDAARSLGCDLYQGYFLARPARPRDVPGFWATPK